MDKKDICIIIPIYKESLNEYEIQSIEQCLIVLRDYSIYFIAPKKINIEYYKTNFPSIVNCIFFDDHYFLNIQGYNQLMLNSNFYKKFYKYKYMLIYQTDCYVFKDELLNWANKGYDYIGGIWFDGYNGDPYLGAKLWQPGNGGFSLRKIKTMTKILNSTKRLKNLKQLVKEKNERNKVANVKTYILLLLRALGYKNNLRYYAKNFNKNEDSFFVNLYLDFNLLSMPSTDDALFFSWDTSPEFLYSKLGKLPFGCHAWYRDEYPYKGNKDFWFEKIQNL